MCAHKTTNRIDLQVGSSPGWEQELHDEEKLKSVSESCVVLQSLRQSRERWLTTAFPKFTNRARGNKVVTPAPPPHTIQPRGRCDLEIGPHIFPDTTFFEVHYIPVTTYPATPSSAYPYQSSYTPGSWQATTPYGASYTPYTPRSPMPQAAPASTPAQASTSVPVSKATPATAASTAPQAPTSTTTPKPAAPLISSLNTVTTITPELINQVNCAASSNPILANLLQLAAAGRATSEQLKTLGLLIQSLANPTPELPIASSINALPQGPSSMYPSAPPPPIKEFDLVLEFQETSMERWTFPRVPLVVEKITKAGLSYDVVITAKMPFVQHTSSEPTSDGSPAVEPPEEQAVSFRLHKVPAALWDTLSRWMGSEEKIAQNKNILENLKQPSRLYLSHQLCDGALLTQLQALSAPPFPTKPIKLGVAAAARPKRKAAPRKSNPAVTATAIITGDDAEKTAGSKDKDKPATKRRKASTTKPNPTSSHIQCVSCKQTDVPLILGGRFCRPCVEAGRGHADIPQTYKASTYVPARPIVAPVFAAAAVATAAPPPPVTSTAQAPVPDSGT